MLKNFVHETASGTAWPLVLDGPLATGYRTVLSAFGAGKKALLTIRNRATPSEWETALYTVGAGGSLTRVAADVRDGTNGSGALVTFTSGIKDVFCDADATLLLDAATKGRWGGATTNSGNAYTVTLPEPVPTVYTTGMGVVAVINAANTGAATLNVNGLGAKAITKSGTTALAAGDLPAGAVVALTYDGTQFQLSSGASGSSSLTALASGAASAPSLAWSGEATGFYRWSTAGVSLSLGGKEVMRSYSEGTPSGASSGANHYLRIGQNVSGADCFQISLSKYGGDTDMPSVGYGFLLKSANGLRGGISSTSPYLDLICPTSGYYGGIAYRTPGGSLYSSVDIKGSTGICFTISTDSYLFTINIDQQGSVKTFRPGSDNVVSLGHASYRWATVYAASGTISTSDARLKTDIADSDLGLEFISALRPVRYRMADQPAQSETVRTVGEDGEIVETVKETEPAKTFARPHYGLIAQEVKEVIDSLSIDFAGYTDPTASGNTGPLGLRYEEFIGPLIKAVQELSAKNAALEARIAALEAP